MSTPPRPSDSRARSALAALKRHSAARSGFTVIEVLVATLILTIGIVGLITSFTSSQALGTSAEAHQTAAALAEAELERLHALSWEYLGLTSAEIPTRSSASGAEPTLYEVSPSTETCTGKAALETNCYEWNWNETAAHEPIAILTTAASGEYENPRTLTVPVTTGSGAGTSLSFKIYRFITWVSYAEGSSCTASECASSDPKRIVVAVTGSNLRKPVVLVTVVSNRETEKTPFKNSSSLKCEEEGGTTTSCLPAS